MSIVVLQIADPRWKDPAMIGLARACASRAIEGYRPERANLRLTGDSEMQALNRYWRAIDRPTNVLSFPQEDSIWPEDADPELGDVAIGFETTEREAMERGLPLSHHLAHLAVHGMLHLVGFRTMIIKGRNAWKSASAPPSPPSGSLIPTGSRNNLPVTDHDSSQSRRPLRDFLANRYWQILGLPTGRDGRIRHTVETVGQSMTSRPSKPESCASSCASTPSTWKRSW